MTEIKFLFLFRIFYFQNIIYSLNVFIAVSKMLNDRFIHNKWSFIENEKMLMTQTIVKFCNILSLKWQTTYIVFTKHFSSNWPKILLANYCIITTLFLVLPLLPLFHFSFFAIKFNPFSTPSAINIFRTAGMKCFFKERYFYHNNTIMATTYNIGIINMCLAHDFLYLFVFR